MIKSAVFSDCRKYRYTLSRYWDQSKGYAQFICLNPSTADETKDDPTVRRCINYSKDWGYGGFVMTNLFGFRATDPKIMMAESNPIGPSNTAWIESMAGAAGIVIAAWGFMGSHQARANAVATLPALKDKLHFLALTKGGEPRHPLYLKKNLKPISWKILIFMLAGYVERCGFVGTGFKPFYYERDSEQLKELSFTWYRSALGSLMIKGELCLNLKDL